MTGNFEKVFSVAARQRALVYALVTALTLILLAHAPVVPVLAGCAIAAAGSVLRARMRSGKQPQR